MKINKIHLFLFLFYLNLYSADNKKPVYLSQSFCPYPKSCINFHCTKPECIHYPTQIFKVPSNFKSSTVRKLLISNFNLDNTYNIKIIKQPTFF